MLVFCFVRFFKSPNKITIFRLYVFFFVVSLSKQIIRADHRSSPALSCSVESDYISRFLWFSVKRIGPSSGSLSDSGLCFSSLFCAGGVHELSSATSFFNIFSRSLRLRRNRVLELVNTVNERGATLAFTMPVSLHLFFIESPGFNNSSSLVSRLSR